MNKVIEPQENLYRAVKPYAIYKKEGGRISSALFKCSKGVSADREGKRTQKEIVTDFIKRFGEDQVKAIAYFDAEFCYQLPSYLKYEPLPENEYHSGIYDSKEKIELSSIKAKKLADYCKLISA